ncbi:MAG TPA: isochorismate synthase, partial [Nocardioides sp.]|nr:isochorismate synthase [Nocardioides sp.]
MSLIVRTTCLSASDDLLDHLPKEHPLAWVRRGEGLVAWGRAAEIRTAGPTRFSDAGKWFT